MAHSPVPGDHDRDYGGGGALPTWHPLATNDVECPVCERSYGRRPPIQLLHALWHEAQDVGMPLINAFPSLLNVLHDQRWLTDDEYELWRKRLPQCPEYVDSPTSEHSGGRAWCAYCGDVTRYQTVVCEGCHQNFMRQNCPVYEDDVSRCIDCWRVWQEEVAAQTIAAHREAQAAGLLPEIKDQRDTRPLPMVNWPRPPEES